MKKLYFFILSIAFIFFSCDKEETEKMMVSGQVQTPTSELTSPADVMVKLYAQKITSGTWNTSYSLVTSQKTNANGQFSLSFDAIRASAYRIELSKDKYFDITSDIDPSNIVKGQNYIVNYEIHPEAYLRLNIINTSPFNNLDKMNYYFSNGALECSDTITSYIGTTVNTSKVCKVYGGQEIQLNWNVKKNNQVNVYNTAIYATPFDTTTYNLFY